MFDNFDIYLDRILLGLPATLWAVFGGIGLTIVLSFAAGIGLLSPRRWVRIPVRVYVEGFRGSSEIVQLFFFAVALSIFLGIPLAATPLNALMIGIMVLGLNHGSYGAEIVRGAVQSVPRAQHEGAVALNFSPAQRMWRVLLPQAVVEMLPSLNNLFIQLVKGSALLSLIAVPEMTKKADELRAIPAFAQDLWMIYLTLLVFYFVISVGITWVMRLLETLAAARVGRPIPSREKALARGGAA